MTHCRKCKIPLTEENRAGRKNICKSCKNNEENIRIKKLRSDPSKIDLIYSNDNYCIKCNDPLTKENWNKTSATKSFKVCTPCNNVIKSNAKKKLKENIIAKYGGKCVCCGISNIIFLTIDHISNDGAEHRKSINGICGNSFYHWLKKEGYPKDNYQILCFNCNFAKHVLGTCPHQAQVVII